MNARSRRKGVRSTVQGAATEPAAFAELWTCPKCGRRLYGRNMAHSCTDTGVETFLRGSPDRVRALFAKFESMIAKCGPYFVSPAKTRVAFMAKVRFCGVWSKTRNGIGIAFSLPYPVRDPRFMKAYEIVPGWWFHRQTITRRAQLDAKLQAWLKESYRLMGMQERLRAAPTKARPTARRAPGSTPSRSRRRARR